MFINNVTEELLPAQTALPLAVIIFELLANALDHAFDPEDPACYITVSLVLSSDSMQAPRELRLTVSDSGCGMPESLALREPESEGLRMALLCSDTLDGNIKREETPGTTIEVVAMLPPPGPPNDSEEP